MPTFTGLALRICVLSAAGFLLPVLLICTGCTPFPGSRARGDSPALAGPLQGLSLIEIGERAMETGENLQEQGLNQGALESYERAQWAFEYHQELTGEAPLLLDHARNSAAQLRRKFFSPKNPK